MHAAQLAVVPEHAQRPAAQCAGGDVRGTADL